MRNSRRHLPYAVSTVLGLAAPAVAAMFLTASTPGLAAVLTPAAASVETDHDLHSPMVVNPAPAVRTTVAQHVAKPATQTVRRTTTTTTTQPAKQPTTSQSAQPWGTNDYPYKSQSDFYAMDKWGFTERQCVSFAAWRLAQHGDTINNSDNWGSAYSWDEAARRLGKTVTTKAHVGAIAQWNANESGAYYSKGSTTPNGHFTAGGYGHVGWVKQVYADGSALVEQYNMGGDRSYSTMRVKAPRYLVL